MSYGYNKERFKFYLQKALGEMKAVDFAEIAGVSRYQISRYLNCASKNVPSKTTIRKIAQASEGRVTETQLLYACGYPVLAYSEEDRKAFDEGLKEERVLNRIAFFTNGLKELVGKAAKYASIEALLDSVNLSHADGVMEFVIKDEYECYGNTHLSAENRCTVNARWTDKDQGLIEYTFVLYYCKTANGGYIFSDLETNLEDLTRLDIQEAYGMVRDIMEKRKEAKLSQYRYVWRDILS